MEKRLHVKAWYSLIKDDTIRNKAIKNRGDIKSSIQLTVNEAINCFDWSKSPEKHEYWYKIHKSKIELREPVKIDKDAVIHIQTQEEWDTVTNYYDLKWLKESVFNKYEEESYINPNYTTFGTVPNCRYKKILSFNDWLNHICAITESTDTLKFEEGKWYIHNDDSLCKIIEYTKNIYNIKATGFDSNRDFKWTTHCDWNFDDIDWKEATDKEVNDRLLHHAKENYPDGVEFYSTLKEGVPGKLITKRDKYRIENISRYGKVVWGGGVGWLFQEDTMEWAELVNEDIPTSLFNIGDYVEYSGEGYVYASPFDNNYNAILKCNVHCSEKYNGKIKDKKYSRSNNRWWYQIMKRGNWVEERALEFVKQRHLTPSECYKEPSKPKDNYIKVFIPPEIKEAESEEFVKIIIKNKVKLINI